jgi:hypothetical protein
MYAEDTMAGASSAEPALASPNAPPDEEARLLQKRMLHYLHRHLHRFCPEATEEQCLEWANDYHNCQFLQSTEVFRLMINVRTSVETVAACLASVSVFGGGDGGAPGGASSGSEARPQKSPPRPVAQGPELDLSVLTETDNELVLFRLMERLYCVIQEVSFPFPQGFHHRFVTLAYRSLPRPLFKQYVANRVLRVTEEFVMRTLDEMVSYDSAADNRFKFFLLSFLDVNALARAHKEWQHPESKRFLAHMTVKTLLAAAEDDRGRQVPSDDDDDIMPGYASQTPSFPPLRAFMRTLQQKDQLVSRLPGTGAESAARVKLSFVEECALLSSSGGSIEETLDVSF